MTLSPLPALHLQLDPAQQQLKERAEQPRPPEKNGGNLNCTAVADSAAAAATTPAKASDPSPTLSVLNEKKGFKSNNFMLIKKSAHLFSLDWLIFFWGG